MRIEAKIQSTISLLDIFFETQMPFDIVMAKFFRSNKWIGSHERREIAEFSYAIFREYETVKYLSKKITANFGRFFVLAYLKYFERRSDTELKEIFSGKEHFPSKLTAFEEKFIKNCDRDNVKELPENAVLNYPEWMRPYYLRAFSKNFDQEMLALNNKALVDLRVNTLKASNEKVEQLLKESGFDVEKTPLAKHGFRILSGRIGRNHPVIAEGLAEIQDEGSQLIAELCNPSSKDTVIDFCAGAGGKTLAIAAAMRNKGRIFALDKYPERLENAKLRFRRAGVSNVTCMEISGKWLKRHRDCAEIVLVDAPCSGTGTWRRNPDMRAKFLQKDLDELVSVQQEILRTAAPLVKKGGHLIYSTCSVLLEENDDQIYKFLEDHTNFRLNEIRFFDTDKKFESDAKFLRLSPYRNNTDGFFAACLERTE